MMFVSIVGQASFQTALRSGPSMIERSYRAAPATGGASGAALGAAGAGALVKDAWRCRRRMDVSAPPIIPAGRPDGASDRRFGYVRELRAGELLAQVEQRGIVRLGRPEDVAALLPALGHEQPVPRSGTTRLHIAMLPALAVRGAEPDEAVGKWLETIVMTWHVSPPVSVPLDRRRPPAGPGTGGRRLAPSACGRRGKSYDTAGARSMA